MMMNEAFSNLTDLQLLTLCIYGEARGEGLDGMLAVGSVVMNRVNHPAWWGKDIKSVILKPWQFSCFNTEDANQNKIEPIALEFDEALKSRNMLRQCRWIAKGILEKELSSNVGPADHYHTLKVDPRWNDNMRFIKRIGRHIFLDSKQRRDRG